MSLSPQDWKDIEEKLSAAYGLVKLLIDGYKITLAVVHIKARRYAIMVYINGWFRDEWTTKDCEERRRFYSRKWVYYLKRAERERMRKYNKRHPKYNVGDPDNGFESYTPFWTSFRRLKAHLIKNNVSIERIATDDHQPV